MVSDQDLKELKIAFQLMDKNGDNRVCASDIKGSGRLLGFTVRDDQVDAFFRRVGTNGKGISEEEFVEWMTRNSRTNGNTLHTAFDVIDKNKDGFITKSELRQGLKFLGTSVSERLLTLMLQYADFDQDGKLSYEDFSQVLEL